jgi:hypothetical protein
MHYQQGNLKAKNIIQQHANQSEVKIPKCIMPIRYCDMHKIDWDNQSGLVFKNITDDANEMIFIIECFLPKGCKRTDSDCFKIECYTIGGVNGYRTDMIYLFSNRITSDQIRKICSWRNNFLYMQIEMLDNYLLSNKIF